MRNVIIDPNGECFIYKKIKSKKYKYEVVQQYEVKLDFMPVFGTYARYYHLSADGVLLIRRGYQWDGASGPTIDTKSTMRASCIHDVLYQTIRIGQMPPSFKDVFDRTLQRIMIEDSKKGGKIQRFWDKFRAGYYYWGVRLFGGFACVPGSEKVT